MKCGIGKVHLALAVDYKLAEFARHHKVCCFYCPRCLLLGHASGEIGHRWGNQLRPHLSVISFTHCSPFLKRGFDLKSHYEQPFTCWTNTPADHKEFWWRAFRSGYTWPEVLNDKVYKEWKKKASERLMDMVFEAMKEKISDWMTTDMKR